MRGALQDTSYQEMKDAPKDEKSSDCVPYDKYTMDLSIVDDKYHATEVGSSGDDGSTCSQWLQPVAHRTFRVGDIYDHDEHTVHTSYPAEDGTITIVKQTKQLQSTNVIYKPPQSVGGAFEPEKHHSFLTMQDIEFVLSEARTALLKLVERRPEEGKARDESLNASS